MIDLSVDPELRQEVEETADDWEGFDRPGTPAERTRRLAGLINERIDDLLVAPECDWTAAAGLARWLAELTAAEADRA